LSQGAVPSPTAAQLSNLFASTESKAVFGASATMSSVIAKSFELVGRVATSQNITDIVTWATSSNLAISQLPWEIMKIALSTEKLLPQASQVAWARLSVAYQFAEDISGNPTALQTLATSTTQQDAARSVISGVTSFATISTAYPSSGSGTAANFVSGAANSTGTPFVLTTGADNFIGTNGNDTFNAANASATAAGQTYNNGDILNGGAGTDTLNVAVGAASTFSLSSVSNIENVVGSFSAAGTVSLLGSSGVTNITSNASTAAAIFNNIASTAVRLGVSNTDQNNTFTFTTAAVAGLTDTATLTLSNQTAGTTSVEGVETLNIVSTGGANALTALTATSATTINISGDTTLNLGTNTVATTIASTSTAGVTLTSNNAAAVTISGGAAADAITLTEGAALSNNVSGGAGNDTITFTANLDTGDTVAGGDGEDTLVALSADLAAQTYTRVSGFETLTVSDALAGTLSTATVQAGINRVNFAAAVASQTVTFEAGAKTISLNLLSAGGAQTLTVGDTGSATTDSLTLLNGTAASDVFAGSDILAITGFETVTVNTSTTTAAGASVALGAIGLTPDTGGSATLNFVGNNSVVTGIITATSATAGVVDASGLTGSRTFSNTGAATVGITSIIGTANADVIVGSATSTTINGGAGNDLITGGAGNDSILGGDGIDSITAAAGNDVINGGEGNDIITLGDNLTQADTIDGGAGTEDVLSVTQATITAVNALSFSNGATLNTNLSNIERLTVTDAVASAVDMARLDNIGFITLNAGGGGQTFSGMVANSTVVIGDTTGGVFTLADATGSADVLNVITTDLDGTASDETFTLVSATSIETVNITTREETADATVRVHTITTLTAGSATAVNISGTESLTVTNATALKNVNASALTNILSLSVANAAAAATVTTGAGADVITGSANGDTLTLGSGADSVNGGDGNDTIDGGSGSDTALYGDLGVDSITGGEGSDSIAGGAGNDTIILTETTAVTDTIYIGSSDTGGTNLAIASNIDTITGFTAGTNGDLMIFDIGTVIVTNGTQKVATLSADGVTLTSLVNTATAGDVDILIVLGEYATYAAVQATLNSTAGAITDATNAAVVIWRDGSGNTRVFNDTNISAGAGTGTELATLVGVNTASLVAANFDVTAT